MRKNKKAMIITVCLLSVIICLLAYYYPVQKHFAEQKLESYMSEQGVVSEDIESISYHKEYKQDGYFIKVTFKNDPYKYYYTYYLIRSLDIKNPEFDKMTCEVFNSKDVAVYSKQADMKYIPLEWK